ncbi:MAG TPA: amidohydrolase family protein, partial [Prolixibacteraceae bacterium]|nr:amidohydrolase family protein [Prolixibacteraceae bacterium]
SPAIFMTGPLLTTWEPAVFKNLGNEEPFFEMKTVEQARDYVKKQLPYHPDFIKIWYIVLGKNVDSSARASLPLVKAVIEEAHRNGLRVAVHATQRITAMLSVDAGADFLVHSVDDEPIDDAFIKLLRTKKTVLSPTLVVESNYNKAFGQSYEVSSHHFKYAHPKPLNSLFDMKAVDTAVSNRYFNYARSKNAITAAHKKDSIMRSNLRKLANGGVIIATGTDAGNIGTQHVSSYYDELKAMSESGMDMWQLLQASTINGAKAVGKESEFGTVTIGKTANMVLLNSNPLEHLDNWQNIEWVINKGELIKPASLVQPTPEELADQQLLAYNAHNLEAFLTPYADDIEVYGASNKLKMKGKLEMRKAYKFLESTPKLYCRLLNRIVQGNIVIDHEEVWGFGEDPFYGIAIYEIKNGKISKVYFPD